MIHSARTNFVDVSIRSYNAAMRGLAGQSYSLHERSTPGFGGCISMASQSESTCASPGRLPISRYCRRKSPYRVTSASYQSDIGDYPWATREKATSYVKLLSSRCGGKSFGDINPHYHNNRSNGRTMYNDEGMHTDQDAQKCTGTSR